MIKSEDCYLVEGFRLSGALKEFEDYSRDELQRLCAENASFDDAAHREAAELVLSRLHAARPGGAG